MTAARVVFMGSPRFAVPSLRALYEAGHEVALVVTQPDRPAGRGGRTHAPAVKLAAESLGIPVAQPDSMRDEGFRERLRSLGADLIVVAAYGRILPQAVLDMPKRGCLNVHASLLPRWRGPSPIAAAILADDPETGVTIMTLVRQMDAGPILARASIPIPPSATTASLEPELAKLGADLLVATIPGWLRGDLAAEPQDESLVTYCKLLTKSDGYLTSSMTAPEASRAVRAFNPWPTASVGYGDGRLNIWEAHVVAADPAPPGTTAVIDRLPAVAFHFGWIALDEVQKMGGKRISGQAFLNGERGWLAAQVELV